MVFVMVAAVALLVGIVVANAPPDRPAEPPTTQEQRPPR
jgi:hypothetical protein